MKKCENCGKEIKWYSVPGKNFNPKDVKNEYDDVLKNYAPEDKEMFVCLDCDSKLEKEEIAKREEIARKLDKVVEIKCPFCEKKFRPESAELSSSTGGNIVRGALFLPWGIISAVKKGIICPHCKMKIKQ